MELIKNIIIEYLKHNKRLVVPKLGAFIVKQPSGIVRFSELMRTDDGVLRSLLMAYGVSSLEANGMIDRMVFEIRHAITIGEEYDIKGFGTFSPGENNNIIFRHDHEPIKVGGNIKPPIEALVIVQQRLRRNGVRPVHISAPASHSNKVSSRRATTEASQSEISITKPDNYLRGLNYDKTKGRKHSDESRSGGSRSRSRGRNGRRALPIAIVVILLAGIVVGAWYLWQHYLAVPIIDTIPTHDIEVRYSPADSLTTDSLIICSDTLCIEPNNTVIE
ncbi:MAG: hypothetical protein J6R81_00990 [Alistipes sp.]|nr:hypothetical protein [Alistipes sp.]